MSLYKYKAKDKEGKIYERSLEVKDRLDIYKVIREEGGSIVSIQEVRSIASSISFGNIFGGIKTHQKIIFAKNLGLMMDAGLPVTRALAVMSKQTKNKSFKKLLFNLEEDVSHGKTLSESLSKQPKVFSKLFTSMVKAGEESGNVAGSLTIVSSQMEKTYLLAKKVRGALIYPAVIISVMIILAILLLIFMVPTLTATFEGIGVKLPLATRVIIYISNFLIENTLIVLAVIILFIISVFSFIRSKIGKNFIDNVSIRIPVIGGIIKEFESARTARTLSSLLSAGVEIVVSLNVTIDVLQNHLYKSALENARTAVEKGEPMSAVFTKHENLYPLFVGEMIAVGEETGKITDMLKGVANYYEEEVDQKTKDLLDYYRAGTHDHYRYRCGYLRYLDAGTNLFVSGLYLIMSQNKGFTLIEIVVAVAIFAIFAVGVYQGYAAIYSAIASARHKALATDLANAKFEIIKNLPYSNVGIVGGKPSGVITAVETVVRDRVTFTITTTIMNIDDPFDGISGGGDIFPADYKLVEINIDCLTCNNFSPVVITGRVAPKNLESALRRIALYLT